MKLHFAGLIAFATLAFNSPAQAKDVEQTSVKGIQIRIGSGHGHHNGCGRRERTRRVRQTRSACFDCAHEANAWIDAMNCNGWRYARHHTEYDCWGNPVHYNVFIERWVTQRY